MIERAKTVMLCTGGYGCRMTVINSVMSAKKLRRILLKYGGIEMEAYFWFNDGEQLRKAVEELSEAGAYLNP